VIYSWFFSFIKVDVGLLMTRRPQKFTSSPALIRGHSIVLSTRSVPKPELKAKKIAPNKKTNAISAG
jgi:hypothetical protein